MTEVFLTRLNVIYESALQHISTAQCALKDVPYDYNQLELINSKLKSANLRLITEIHNYYKLVSEPNVDEIRKYTMAQIQAEDLISGIDIKLKINDRELHTLSVASANNNITSKLPQLELAKFDGDVLKWYQFWDQFSSNVDSRNINDVDKLLYLQSVLIGEAKQAIDGLDTTNKNYSIAVDTLKNRYGKPGAIIDAHYVALYRIKPISTNNIKECRQVLNELERHLRVLSSLGENVNHNHLRVMIMEKFPEDLIYELRMKLSGEEETIDCIRKYLEYIISAKETSNRLKKDIVGTRLMDRSSDEPQQNIENFTLGSLHVTSERVDGSKQSRLKSYKSDKPRLDNKFFVKYSNMPTRKRAYEDLNRVRPSKRKLIKCIFCTQDHYNDECTTYKTLQERKKQLGNRCYCCFSKGHLVKECHSKRKCRHCNKLTNHNRALCPIKFVQSTKSIKSNNLYVQNNLGPTLLQTSIAIASNTEGEIKQLRCRILLDCGSQRSYITETTSSYLNLSVVEKVNLSIFTFGTKSPRQIETPVVVCRLITRIDVMRTIYVSVVPHITNGVRTPTLKDTAKLLNNLSLSNITLADDGVCGDKIDILIGNDYYHSFMSDKRIQVSSNLYLVETQFGWVWSGQINDTIEKSDQVSVLTYFHPNTIINKLNEPDLPLRSDDVQKLWDLESIGITDSPKSTHDEEALRHFNETVQYINNRYQVQWPWIEYPPDLPNNLGIAYGRLNSLLKRLDAQEIECYNNVIQDQLKAGIIERVPDPTAPQAHPVHYLPHHCVYNKDKPNKPRIVYDASAKLANSKSLNECLYRGPLILEDLTGLLIKFREYPIGILADVEKAFLQIGLQVLDRDVTRFLWLRDKTSKPSSDNIEHYRFCRVPFGVISSPFLLNATVKYHLSKSNNVRIKELADDIYVDNIVTGAHTISDAIKLYEDSRQTFSDLSMNLREWISNSKELVTIIPDKYKAENNKLVKVLGLRWEIELDQLHLNIGSENYNLKPVKTKRDVLQIIASIYDPCGFAIPIVLPAKLFFQKLWKERVKWDAPLNEQQSTEWQSIVSKFSSLKDIHVNRYYAQNLRGVQNQEETRYELHCFTDASLEAYAAVVYLRCSSLSTNNIVNFIIGKSRLVPLKDQKNLQIPRLELLGVLIGSRLINYVMKFLRINIKAQFLWTDSQVVLSWCHSEKLLPPFVSRRINEINRNRGTQIKYIPTKYNPADVGTRSERVKFFHKWLRGPEFLSKDPQEWPRFHNYADEETQNQVSLAEEGFQNNIPSNSITRQESDKNMLGRVSDTACPNSDNDDVKIILEIQAEFFPNEAKGIITDLAKSLQLYKDKDGLIRCKGRFKYTDLTQNQKEPILLPKNSEFTHKIILEIHRKNYHVGVSHTLALLRKTFWVPQGRSVVQSVIKKCLQCKKYGGGPFKLPGIPDLPEERVKLSLPFSFVGVDYFGPLYVSETIKEKRWVCLFTCLTVRAIHMEVVKDLTAEEFLLAVRRFIAVRGLPKLFISDNALQFKLSADILTSDYCIDNKIQWRFIPELAPWFGGFYERLIGLVKHCMKRTLDKHLINNNQLCTIIKEIEAVLNTRPLTTVGAEPEDVLSPIDFLRVGGPVIPQTSDRHFLESATVTKQNLIDGWKRGQIIVSEFRNMFTNQYLTSLRERSDKHRQPRVVVNRAPKLSEIVQLKSDGNRAHWKVGKITELRKSSDGQIRVAKVKVPTGETFTRSIGHLYPLEIEDEQYAVTKGMGSSLTPKTMEKLKKPQGGEPIQVHSEKQSANVGLDLDSPKLGEYICNETEAPISSLKDTNKRPVRISAIKARERVKEWTNQLMTTLFELVD